MHPSKALFVAVSLLGCAACAPSEEEVKAEFAAEVARSRSCEQASDCVMISPGCPLGCWVAVSATHQERVARKARELIEDYESGGTTCAYGCTEAPRVVCTDQVCASEP